MGTQFEHLRDLLSSHEYPSEILPLEGTQDARQLVLLLGEDERGREVFMQVMFISDANPDMPAQGDGVDLMQFYAHLPFEVSAGAYPDLTRFLLAVNNWLPIAGFGLLEEQRAVYFRHVAMCPDRLIDDRVVLATVDLADLAIAQYGALIEDVATGIRTLAQGLDGLPTGADTDD